jgi:hypothetical protein
MASAPSSAPCSLKPANRRPFPATAKAPSLPRSSPSEQPPLCGWSTAPSPSPFLPLSGLPRPQSQSGSCRARSPARCTPSPAMSVDTERSSTESSAASRLGYEDTTLALTLRLPGSDSGRSSSLAAPSDAAPSPKARVVGWPPVRSYRKNALADSSKANRAANFVKVVVSRRSSASAPPAPGSHRRSLPQRVFFPSRALPSVLLCSPRPEPCSSSPGGSPWCRAPAHLPRARLLPMAGSRQAGPRALPIFLPNVAVAIQRIPSPDDVARRNQSK